MTPEETLRRLIHQAEAALELVEAGLVTLEYKDQLGLLPAATFIVGDFEIHDKLPNKMRQRMWNTCKKAQGDPHTPG